MLNSKILSRDGEGHDLPWRLRVECQAQNFSTEQDAKSALWLSEGAYEAGRASLRKELRALIGATSR